MLTVRNRQTNIRLLEPKSGAQNRHTGMPILQALSARFSLMPESSARMISASVGEERIQLGRGDNRVSHVEGSQFPRRPPFCR